MVKVRFVGASSCTTDSASDGLQSWPLCVVRQEPNSCAHLGLNVYNNHTPCVWEHPYRCGLITHSSQLFLPSCKAYDQLLYASPIFHIGYQAVAGAHCLEAESGGTPESNLRISRMCICMKLELWTSCNGFSCHHRTRNNLSIPIEWFHHILCHFLARAPRLDQSDAIHKERLRHGPLPQ